MMSSKRRDIITQEEWVWESNHLTIVSWSEIPTEMCPKQCSSCGKKKKEKETLLFRLKVVSFAWRWFKYQAFLISTGLVALWMSRAPTSQQRCQHLPRSIVNTTWLKAGQCHSGRTSPSCTNTQGAGGSSEDLLWIHLLVSEWDLGGDEVTYCSSRGLTALRHKQNS